MAQRSQTACVQMRAFTNGLLRFLPLVLILHLCGCDDAVDREKKDCHLASISGTVVTYDNNNQVTEINSDRFLLPIVQKVKYDAAGKIVEISYPNPDPFYEDYPIRELFFYDPDGRLQRKDFIEGEWIRRRTEYGYNAPGQLIRIDHLNSRRSAPDELTLVRWDELGYDDETSKNPTVLRKFSASLDKLEYTSAFKYDDKNNPAHSMDLFLVFETENHFGVYSENNVVEVETVDNVGHVRVLMSDYTYNDAGYPTTRTVTSPNETVAIDAATYTYTNCD